MDSQDLKPAAMVLGGRYNWKGQPDRLIYTGTRKGWHQFSKIGDTREVWCEVTAAQLRMLEETPAEQTPSHGCGHMQGRGAA